MFRNLMLLQQEFLQLSLELGLLLGLPVLVERQIRYQIRKCALHFCVNGFEQQIYLFS